MKEYVVWGTRKGNEAWQEELLKSGIGSVSTAQDWKRFVEAKGFVNVRISELDLSTPPNFVATIA